MSNIDITLAEQGKNIDFVHSEWKELHDEQLQSKAVQQEIVKRAVDQQYLINSLMELVNHTERKSREKNLRIVYYPETTGEDVMNQVLVRSSAEDLVVDVAHRTGRSFRLEEGINTDTSFFAWQSMKINTEF